MKEFECEARWGRKVATVRVDANDEAMARAVARRSVIKQHRLGVFVRVKIVEVREVKS